MSIYVNHLGFTPHAAKTFRFGGLLDTAFRIVEESTERIVHQGEVRRVSSDFGFYSAAEFSNLLTPGEYHIEVDRERSHTFRIAPDLYYEPLKKIVGYLTLQRCGDTDKGWHGCCHIDDGIRIDNGQRQDVSGGWHDACDLRKWASAAFIKDLLCVFSRKSNALFHRNRTRFFIQIERAFP